MKDVIKELTELHAADKHITLAAFGMLVTKDIELAQEIVTTFAQDFDTSIQMHMQNMINAQLQLNAAHDAISRVLLKHALELLDSVAEDNTATQAEQATADFLSKFKLH